MDKFFVSIVLCFTYLVSFADDYKWDAAKEKEYQDYIRKEEAKEKIKEKEWEFVNRREKEKEHAQQEKERAQREKALEKREKIIKEECRKLQGSEGSEVYKFVNCTQ